MPADIPISKSAINSKSTFNDSILPRFFIILPIFDHSNLKYIIYENENYSYYPFPGNSCLFL